MEKHELLISNSIKPSVCSCGMKFSAPPEDAVARWQEHVESGNLLRSVRAHVLQERASREAGEDAIRRLLQLGLSSRKISDAIGQDEAGTLLVSPTLVLRLGRAERAQTPRRRRRKTD